MNYTNFTLNIRCVVTYYCALMALAFFYFFCSFQNPLPWTVCDPAWSSNETCYGTNDNFTGMNLTGKRSSAEEFFVYIRKRFFRTIEIEAIIYLKLENIAFSGITC